MPTKVGAGATVGTLITVKLPSCTESINLISRGLVPANICIRGAVLIGPPVLYVRVQSSCRYQFARWYTMTRLDEANSVK